MWKWIKNKLFGEPVTVTTKLNGVERQFMGRARKGRHSSSVEFSFGDGIILQPGESMEIGVPIPLPECCEEDEPKV